MYLYVKPKSSMHNQQTTRFYNVSEVFTPTSAPTFLIIKVSFWKGWHVYRIYWLNLTVYKDNSELKVLTLEITLPIEGTITTVHVK